MAMEQKKRMEVAKKSGHFVSDWPKRDSSFSGIQNYSGSSGGFVGIDQLTSWDSFQNVILFNFLFTLESNSNARQAAAIKKIRV